MTMTLTEQLITIAVVVVGTVITRALPFLLFPSDEKTPKIIKYLSNFLPGAVFAMLVVFCLKGVDFTSGSYGIPEIISIGVVLLLHLWKKQMLLSIACGTALYMFLVQVIF